MAKQAEIIGVGWKLFIFFLLLVLSIVWLYIRLLFTSKDRQQRLKFSARRTFCKQSNSIFGIELVTIGEIPEPDTYLYISNHRSFYDPVAFLSLLIANPISKAEVSRYPLIGWGANLTEVLMLDRSEMEERRRMKYRISECLKNGTSILLYPEGTTTSAPLTGQFKKGGFESAIRAGKKVVPIAMEYPDESYYWIDRPIFDQFVKQVTRGNDRRIFLGIGKPIQDPDPIQLLDEVRESIHEMISHLREKRKKE